MPLGTPIQFTLYDDNDQIIEIYSRARVPLIFVERAIELSEKLGGDSMGQDQLMALYQIIVDFYGGKFSVEELRAGADLGEMISVIMAITARATELMPSGPKQVNPINPPG